DRTLEEIDGARGDPPLVHRQARERRAGGAATPVMVAHRVPVEVIDLQIPFAGEQTRQRRLSRLRTASDPQHVSQPRAHVLHAQLDRAPLVAITGQAGLERVHLESHQYIDVVQMFTPVTKWSTRVSVPESVPEVVRKAFRLARLEKPGATHIELPEDVAKEDVRSAPLELRRTSYPQAQREAIDRAAEIINAAKSPVILAGNGVTRRNAVGNPTVDALRRFVERSRIWATHTYMAKGVLDPLGQHSLPPVGLQRAGADLANLKILAEADVVIAIGYDLVEWAPVLCNPKRDKTVVHVDSTAAELDGHYQPSIEVIGELDESLAALAEA